MESSSNDRSRFEPEAEGVVVDNAPAPDFEVTGAGTLYIVTPQTDDAAAHLDEVLDPENSTRWGRGVAVEHRYVRDFMARLQEDGFSVR